MDLKSVLREMIQIPELSTFKNPLFVGPHPDDIEFGCGSLISKMNKKGTHPHFLIVTDGSAGTDDPMCPPSKLKEIRENEARNSGRFLGASTVDFIGFEDGGIFEVEDVTREVSKYILKYMPDIIFVVDPMLSTETHADHLKVGEGVRRAIQIVGYPETLRRHHVEIENVKEFPRNIFLAYYFTDSPNIFTEISKDDLDNKIKALMCHESQMADPGSKILLQYFALKAEEDGKRGGFHLAESFRVIHPYQEHVYSEGLFSIKWELK